MSAKSAAKAPVKSVAATKHIATTKHTTAPKKHTETAKQKAALVAGAKKAAATRKANKAKVTTKAKAAAPAKAASFGIGDWLPVCAFEAVGQSLRLAGQPVHDDEVAELWHLLGERPEGAPVGGALAAWNRFGVHGGGLAFLQVQPEPGVIPARGELAADVETAVVTAGAFHALILHVDVPGPHAVLATADGWWSWGELHDPWPCRISEAWAVSWS